MAHPIVRALSKIHRISGSNLGVISISRSLSSKSPSESDPSSLYKNEKVLVGKANNDTFVCWHPEQPFPYEHTKPVPRNIPEMAEGDSVLKVQYMIDYKNRYKPEGPPQAELEKMFFTTKHAWRPKSRDKRYEDPNPPKDRESI